MDKQLVYIKDSEGYVCAKALDQVSEGEIIISQEEYEEISGIAYYKKISNRGGARQGAGRKRQYTAKKRETFDLEESDLNFLKTYAKKHNLSKNKALQEAIKTLKQSQSVG